MCQIDDDITNLTGTWRSTDLFRRDRWGVDLRLCIVVGSRVYVRNTLARFEPVGQLRLFLYPAGRYGAEPFGISPDLANRLRAFVPPPAEATFDAEDDLPQSVDIPRYARLRKGETPTFDRVELVRRDMESAAPRDLQSVLRLIDLGRVAASAKTRRASATAVQRIAEVLDGGDFFDPTEKKERWEQTVGPIRAFAWPWLLQAGKLAECHGSKLALTKAGHAALGAPAAPALRRLWQRWIKSTLLDEFSRIDDIKGQHRGKGRRAMTAASGRRPVIAEALAQCPVGALRRLPALHAGVILRLQTSPVTRGCCTSDAHAGAHASGSRRSPFSSPFPSAVQTPSANPAPACS